MKKYQFLQHKQQIVDQLKTNIKAIEDITYDDYLRASEQSKSEGHEDPECTAMYGLIIPHISMDIDQLF